VEITGDSNIVDPAEEWQKKTQILVLKHKSNTNAPSSVKETQF
jgi:hypothetical protein